MPYTEINLDAATKIADVQIRFCNRPKIYSPTISDLITIRKGYRSVHLGVVLAARCQFMPLVSPTAVMLFCSVDHDPGCDIYTVCFHLNGLLALTERI
jgi:hypothetical protein